MAKTMRSPPLARLPEKSPTVLSALREGYFAIRFVRFSVTTRNPLAGSMVLVGNT